MVSSEVSSNHMCNSVRRRRSNRSEYALDEQSMRIESNIECESLGESVKWSTLPHSGFFLMHVPQIKTHPRLLDSLPLFIRRRFV